ncbi:hypothetical protein [Streptomyces sp. NPDC001091]
MDDSDRKWVESTWCGMEEIIVGPTTGERSTLALLRFDRAVGIFPVDRDSPEQFGHDQATIEAIHTLRSRGVTYEEIGHRVGLGTGEVYVVVYAA